MHKKTFYYPYSKRSHIHTQMQRSKSICSHMYQPITRGYPVPSQAGLLTQVSSFHFIFPAFASDFSQIHCGNETPLSQRRVRARITLASLFTKLAFNQFDTYHVLIHFDVFKLYHHFCSLQYRNQRFLSLISIP